jgi:hypothetical protein
VIKKAIAVGVAALALAGCSTIKSGTVTDKDYTAPWVQIMPGTSGRQECYGTGTTRTCTYIPGTPSYPVYHSADWELRLKNSREEGWREVSESEYNRYEVGQQYP